jgi:hypothetical protein
VKGVKVYETLWERDYDYNDTRSNRSGWSTGTQTKKQYEIYFVETPYIRADWYDNDSAYSRGWKTSSSSNGRSSQNSRRGKTPDPWAGRQGGQQQQQQRHHHDDDGSSDEDSEPEYGMPVPPPPMNGMPPGMGMGMGMPPGMGGPPPPPPGWGRPMGPPGGMPPPPGGFRSPAPPGGFRPPMGGPPPPPPPPPGGEPEFFKIN